MIILPESDEDLLRECEIETLRSSGPGGQHVNKTESGSADARAFECRRYFPAGT
jgi:protein subunit release factor A